MPTENRTATPNLQSEPFVTTNLIAASGAASGGVTRVSSQPQESLKPSAGSAAGIEDEETLWDGRYSPKNFLGRAIFAGLVVFAWVALALATWGFGHSGLAFVTYVTGGAALLYCLYMGFKFVRVRRNHYYRLTSRRLFLTTGIFYRRVDQIELIRVKDLRTANPGQLVARRGLRDFGLIRADPAQSRTAGYRGAPWCVGPDLAAHQAGT